MGTRPKEDPDLLARADEARAAGRGADAARLYDQAALEARARDDHSSWARAVLGAASVQVFGAEPGRLPSLLYDVLVRTTDDALRSRLAAALARCWVYAGEAGRALPFAEEALERARLAGEPGLLADALDAQLAVHWGPDDLEVRRELTRELDDVAAHIVDAEARLQAHLWGLQVASEALDLQAMHRHLRALELMGESDARARFFAATRRFMLDLLRGRTDTYPVLAELAAAAAAEVHIPDAAMMLGGMEAYWATQTGDAARVEAGLAPVESFALEQPSMCSEIAFCLAVVGSKDRARVFLDTMHGGVLGRLPRDVNWLLTLQCTLEAALLLGDLELVEEATDLLRPYAGRAVINGGAVMFQGVTDDPLSRAFTLLGEDGAEELRARALRTYERIGASWWRDRLERQESSEVAPRPIGVHLRPSTGGLWVIGRDAVPVPGLRGLGYLRELVSRPGRPLAALDLVGAGGPVLEESGTGELADRRALAAYRQRLADLEAELVEAEDWADAGRAEAARAEKEALLAELGRVSGLNGRARTGGSSAERARVAVKKAITTAIARIESVDEPLARHLRRTVQTGQTCVYEPEPDELQDWVLR